jgi:hypothetical protein
MNQEGYKRFCRRQDLLTIRAFLNFLGVDKLPLLVVVVGETLPELECYAGFTSTVGEVETKLVTGPFDLLVGEDELLVGVVPTCQLGTCVSGATHP